MGRRGSARRSSTRSPRSGTRSPSASASTSRRPPTRPGPPSPAPTRSRARRERSADGAAPSRAAARLSQRCADPPSFKYLLIAPAIFVLLLIGLFPLVYSARGELPEHQHDWRRTPRSAACSTTARCSHDARFWQALLHTFIFTAIALPHRAGARACCWPSCSSSACPGRQIFVALLVLPVVISPIVAGATWSLLFDNRFGPINQIIGWIAGERR